MYWRGKVFIYRKVTTTIGIGIGIGIATSSIVVDLFKWVQVFRRGRIMILAEEIIPKPSVFNRGNDTDYPWPGIFYLGHRYIFSPRLQHVAREYMSRQGNIVSPTKNIPRQRS